MPHTSLTSSAHSVIPGPLPTNRPAEIFLPSYVDHDYVPLENRRDPIHEIYLTDEEAATMLPQ